MEIRASAASNLSFCGTKCFSRDHSSIIKSSRIVLFLCLVEGDDFTCIAGFIDDCLVFRRAATSVNYFLTLFAYCLMMSMNTHYTSPSAVSIVGSSSTWTLSTRLYFSFFLVLSNSAITVSKQPSVFSFQAFWNFLISVPSGNV